MKKILMVLSGGMDSAVAMASLMEEADSEVALAVSFLYGSKHNERENRAAKAICDHYSIKHMNIELPFIGKFFKSALLKSGGEIPEGHYEDPTMKETVVPFRNGIMLSIAAGLADSVGANCIGLGNHAGDHAIYPDCRLTFTQHMATAIKVGTYGEINLVTPFVKMTKAQIVELGFKLSVPFSLTYSCYKGGYLHCGKCGTCFERKEAFRDAGIIDPTQYL